MGYIVSILAGALGFAVWDKKNNSQNSGFNLAAAVVQGLLVFYLFKKLGGKK